MNAPTSPTWKPEIECRVIVNSGSMFAGSVGTVRCVWQFPNTNIVTVEIDGASAFIRYYDSELSREQVLVC